MFLALPEQLPSILLPEERSPAAARSQHWFLVTVPVCEQRR